jgi:hypothetical protein
MKKRRCYTLVEPKKHNNFFAWRFSTAQSSTCSITFILPTFTGHSSLSILYFPSVWPDLPISNCPKMAQAYVQFLRSSLCSMHDMFVEGKKRLQLLQEICPELSNNIRNIPIIFFMYYEDTTISKYKFDSVYFIVFDVETKICMRSDTTISPLLSKLNSYLTVQLLI